jgi:hypothetical protein
LNGNAVRYSPTNHDEQDEMMSNDKGEATWHPGTGPAGEPLPIRQPWETFARHGEPPANPAEDRMFYASPGEPPWASRVERDLAVQHGWSGDRRPNSTVAVWALVTGIVGVLAGWCLLGLPCIAAVVLGHVALSQTKTDAVKGRGMAVAGLVLGYVALIPAVIFCLYAVIGAFGGAAPAVNVTPSPWPSFT